jgi:Mycoplasma protein of unknown function, DUF285
MSSTTASCFTTNSELRNAVLQYVQPGVSSDQNSELAIKYGFPIDRWCVGRVTDFSRVFTPPEDDDTGTLFNEDISSWDMSNATSLASMFEGAFAFDQDISSWNVSRVVSIDRMLYRAFAFNQNLCPWGARFNDLTAINVTDAFLETSCVDSGDPVLDLSTGIVGPLCNDCSNLSQQTTATSDESVTDSPTGSPSNLQIQFQPTSLPSTSRALDFDCFQDRVDLELALTEYLTDNGQDTAVATRYGWPINTWCVQNVSDFSRLFSPVNNLDKATFNEDVSGWDMSRAVSLESMFEGNTFFNQDISSWNLGLNTQTAARIFFGASSFNQNLCPWGVRMNELTNVSQMFRGTACATVSDPSFVNGRGPFCSVCDSSIDDTKAPSPTIDANNPVDGSPTISPAQMPAELQPTRTPADTPPEPGSDDDTSSDGPTMVLSGWSIMPVGTMKPTGSPVEDRSPSSAYAKKLIGYNISLFVTMMFSIW